MPRVVHFETLADEPERAGAFYTVVFGLKFEKCEGLRDQPKPGPRRQRV